MEKVSSASTVLFYLTRPNIAFSLFPNEHSFLYHPIVLWLALPSYFSSFFFFVDIALLLLFFILYVLENLVPTSSSSFLVHLKRNLQNDRYLSLFSSLPLIIILLLFSRLFFNTPPFNFSSRLKSSSSSNSSLSNRPRDITLSRTNTEIILRFRCPVTDGHIDVIF